MDRHDYVRSILPHCATKYAAIAGVGEDDEPLGISWIYEADENSVSRAVAAFLDGSLPHIKLKHRTKNARKGTDYPGTPRYLGLVPVDDNSMVHFCVLDFDRKSVKGSIAQPITREEIQLFADWFQARELVAYWSKSGAGAHATVWFKKPFPVNEVVAWAKSWGFRVGGGAHRLPLIRDTDFFPRTEKRSMVWLPMEDEDPDYEGPRAHGLICGTTVEDATSRWSGLAKLPFKNGKQMNDHLDEEELGFLFGFERTSGERNNLMNKVTNFLCHHKMPWKDACPVLLHAAKLCGLLDQENEKTRDTMTRAWADAIADMKAKGEPIETDEKGNPQVATGPGAARKKKEQKAKLHMLVINQIFKKPDDEKSFGNRFGKTGYTPADLYYWENGVYRADGQAEVRSYTRSILRERGELDTDWTPGLRNAVIEGVIDYEDTISLQDPTHPGVLNLESGLLDFNGDKPKLRRHNPEVPSLVQIPIVYKHADAAPEIWNSFLFDLFGHYGGRDAERAIRFMKEVIADCMMPTLAAKKARQQALLLLGPPEQGKSTLVNAITGLIGEENVSNLSLEQIESEKFALCQLFGKALNAHADIGYTKIDTATNFKQICSGDRMLVDRKHGPLLSFAPVCRMIFGANRWPEYRDIDASINRRWIPIQVELKKQKDDRDPNILDKLLSPEAKSGLLQTLLDDRIFERLLEGSPYRVPRVLQEQQEAKVTRREPFLIFKKHHIVLGSRDDMILKFDLMTAYNEWACEHESDIKPVSMEQLEKLVHKHLETEGVDECLTPSNHEHPNGKAWRRIKLRDSNTASLDEEFDS